MHPRQVFILFVLITLMRAALHIPLSMTAAGKHWIAEGWI
jgi:hypothetical protein